MYGLLGSRFIAGSGDETRPESGAAHCRVDAVGLSARSRPLACRHAASGDNTGGNADEGPLHGRTMTDIESARQDPRNAERGRTHEGRGRADRWMSLWTWRAVGRLVRRRGRRWSVERVVATGLAALVFAGSLWVIAHEFQGFKYAEVWAYLNALPFTYVVAGGALTALTFVVLAGYDALALRYVGVRLSTPRIAFSAFVGYAVSQAIGNPILTGGSVRYRLYSLWGLTTAQVAKAILFAGASFWLGFCSLGTGVFLFESAFLGDAFTLPVSPLLMAGLCTVPIAAYTGLALFRVEPLELWEWRFAVPPLWMIPIQIALATADLLLASSVVYVLLPPEIGISFLSLVAVYLTALLAGLVSHVPGGLGVFEGVMLLVLTPTIPAPTVLGALLAYRGVFHLLPLLVALLAFGAYELYQGLTLWADNTPTSDETPSGRSR